VIVERNRHVLVGLARTGSDTDLLRYASFVARLGTTQEIRFVHVLPSPHGSADAHNHDHVLAQIQAEVKEHFTDVPASVRLYYDVLKGPLLDRLLAFSAEQESDLILLGHRRDRPGRKALARRLAMKAPCSVWMIPDGSPPDVKRILVPIDFSEHTADSLAVAVSLAKRCGHTECLALHVYFDESTVTYEGHEEVVRNEEATAYRQFIAPINTQGVTVTPLFEEGANVAHVINRVAAKYSADLIVMATRGRSRSAAILLGSVTEETIIETQVPLLVVKHYGARLGVLGVLLDRNFHRQRGPRFD
jgi:SulP family sulfate permease